MAQPADGQPNREASLFVISGRESMAWVPVLEQRNAAVVLWFNPTKQELKNTTLTIIQEHRSTERLYSTLHAMVRRQSYAIWIDSAMRSAVQWVAELQSDGHNAHTVAIEQL